MNKTLEHITENLERGGKTILRGGLRGTQKFLDAYSARLPWYFEKAPHYTVNEPHRTMIKNCAALTALGVGSFFGLRMFELMHTPEIYNSLGASVENLPPIVKFLAKEASGPLVGFLAGSSFGYLVGSSVAVAVVGAFCWPEIADKTEEKK